LLLRTRKEASTGTAMRICTTLLFTILVEGSVSAFTATTKLSTLGLTQEYFKCRINKHPSCLFSASGGNNEENKVQLPANEFSRPYRTDVILGPKRRDYSLSITANEEERKGLAERFSLSEIAKLEADLILRKDNNLGGEIL